jgi:hypothetical protein
MVMLQVTQRGQPFWEVGGGGSIAGEAACCEHTGCTCKFV